MSTSMITKPEPPSRPLTEAQQELLAVAREQLHLPETIPLSFRLSTAKSFLKAARKERDAKVEAERIASLEKRSRGLFRDIVKEFGPLARVTLTEDSPFEVVRSRFGNPDYLKLSGETFEHVVKSGPASGVFSLAILPSSEADAFVLELTQAPADGTAAPNIRFSSAGISDPVCTEDLIEVTKLSDLMLKSRVAKGVSPVTFFRLKDAVSKIDS